MGAAANSASTLSMASVGLSAGGAILKGIGGFEADKYQSEKLERAAEFGRVKATQTSAQLTERLNNTLGNIDAIRAAGHNDPTSPTGVAVREYAEAQGERQRTISVDNILQQSAQDEADAAYMRHAGSIALLAGGVGGAAALTKGFGPAMVNPLYGG